MATESAKQPADALLECDGMTVAVAGRTLVRQLGFAAPAGSITCMLGRNGTGKSMTLHTLAGLRGHDGSIHIAGRQLETWPQRELACRLTLLPQQAEDPFPATVFETALIGRHPHIGFWQWESDHDRDVAHRALAAMDLIGLEQRDIDTLSGGERRRLAIATVLTQDTSIYLLDEPTNHLDPHHQLDVLRVFRTLADAGRAVIMTLHDAGLAARFADHALLLLGNGDWLHGPAGQILNADNISRLYGTPVRELQWEKGRTFVAL